MDKTVGNYEIRTTGRNITIRKYTGSEKVVIIPYALGNLLVTSIGDYAFFNRPNLTSITLPSSVTSIGEGTFENCSSLTSVTLPSSVTFIGYYAFMGCTSLRSVAIPSSVARAGVGAFPSHTVITRI